MFITRAVKVVNIMLLKNVSFFLSLQPLKISFLIPLLSFTTPTTVFYFFNFLYLTERIGILKLPVSELTPP